MKKNPFAELLTEEYKKSNEYFLLDAIKEYSPKFSNDLLNLLDSPEADDILDGLFIFSEIGKRGKSIKAQVSKFLLDPNVEVRTLVAAGYLSYIDDLSLLEIKNIILNCDTKEKTLSEYVILMIAKIKFNKLKSAIELIEDSNLRRIHDKGYQLLISQHDLNFLCALPFKEKHEFYCYYYAALLKAAITKNPLERENFTNCLSENEFISFVLEKKLL